MPWSRPHFEMRESYFVCALIIHSKMEAEKLAFCDFRHFSHEMGSLMFSVQNEEGKSIYDQPITT